MASPATVCAVALLLPRLAAGGGRQTWIEWIRGEGDGAAPTTTLPRAAPDASRWDPLVQLLQGWEFTSNYAVTVGTAEHGRLFAYEGGSFTLQKRIPTGSTSKWPSAMMFAGLVNDGTVGSLDDPVSKYLTWWTKDPEDLRSTVTFRMLLTFTSGFGGGHPGEEANTRAAREWRLRNNASRRHMQSNVPTKHFGGPSGQAGVRDEPAFVQHQPSLQERLVEQIGVEASKACHSVLGDITKCARSIYNGVDLIGTPGKVYSYNSNHLQIAAAVSVAATGLGIKDVIKKYLFEPFNMTNSLYVGNCPDFGGSLVTTGEDYESFLLGLLSYKGLSKKVVDASEEDATPFMSDMYTLYGNYGFGHFLMCFDSVDGMTDKCREANCHMDPGAFGFIPIIDRKNGYYVQLVAAEIAPTGSYPLSGIPEYLAVAMKPHVDAILGPEPPDPSEHLSHSPRFLSLSIADVNYCLNCVLYPKSCS